MVLSMLAKAEAENRHWDNLALFHFAVSIADHYELDVSDVLDEIERTPAHILDNARSPQGLTAVAFYLGASLGVQDAAALMPAVH